ncbi:MAG: pyridoxamine 5'-phosphate oxidase family protein [Acidimicrobiales bacterium]
MAIRVLSREECLDKLGGTSVGRIAITVEAIPTVVAVRFVVNGNRLIFDVIGGSVPGEVFDNVIVGFQADSFDAHGRRGWTVSGTGFVRRLKLSELWTDNELEIASEIQFSLLSGHELN